MVAIHIFHKLVFGARLYVKMPSWGFCVFVLDSSWEPANRPEEMVCRVACSSGTEFVVGCSTSTRRLLALRQVLPWKFPEICTIIVLCVGKLGTIGYVLLFSRCSWWCSMFLWGWRCFDRSRRRHKRRQEHAVITRRFVPLSVQQPRPVEFGSRKRSRELLEQVFADGKDEFKWGYFKFGSLWVPYFVELFRPFSRWPCNCSS